jgi:hypothetical protein
LETAARENACRLWSRSNSGTAGLHRLCALCRCASCIAMADNRCCRPCHPQVHTARACRGPLSTATTPRRVQPSDRDATVPAKRSAMLAATKAPNGSSDLLVCRHVLVLRHGGQPNRLFPKLGHYSQIRAHRVVGCTPVPLVIDVASVYRCGN